jgi:glycosyltransferase involved in cell wall biosynthesis
MLNFPMSNPINNRLPEKFSLVAIPVYNEFSHIDDILTAVLKHGGDVLVVNDGSRDGADTLLKKYASIKTISHRTNQGYGQSLIDAFEFAKTHNYTWIITMDCDHQHQPAYIPHFIRSMEFNDADIISGSRYLKSENCGAIKPPPDRVAINRNITLLLNRVLGLAITDSFCGFKAYRVEALKKLKLTEKGYGFPLQLWVQAAAANLTIREIAVPLIYHDPKRKFGGLLENPEFRLQYYMNIVERELVLNGRKITSTISCP